MIKSIVTLAIGLGLLFANVCLAASPGTTTKVLPGLDWTKVQDLKPDATSTNRPVKQKWAVVIGVSKFEEKRLFSSEHMDHSAEEFYDYLIDPHGGRMHPDHIKLLINNAATLPNIRAALGKPWLGQLAGPDDLVLVYIATDAVAATDGSTYLCAQNCALDNISSTCISMQNLMESLKTNVPSKRIVLVLQSAYSGAAPLSGAKELTNNSYNVDLAKISVGEGYIILSSSLSDQITFSDVFSRNLIAALREQDGLIKLRDAFEIARSKTESETASSGRKQTPAMKSNWIGNDLVIGAPASEAVAAIPSSVATFLSAESHYLRANNLVIAGDTKAAGVEYQAAIANNPEYADAIADYGSLEFVSGNVDNAIKLYERAIAIRPDDSLFHFNYARILKQQGQLDKSRQELESCLRLNPNDSAALSALSAMCADAGDFTQAVSLLKQSTQLPNSFDLHERLSYLYTRANDLPAAQQEAAEAVKTSPDSAKARLNLGSILLLSGQTDPARAEYKRALEIEPSNANGHLLLSQLLEKSAQRKEASAELRQFIQFCKPGDARLPSARIHLNELTDQ